MKSIKNLVLAGIIAFGTAAFADNPKDDDLENVKLSDQIQQIMDKAPMKIDEEIRAEVRFTFNKDQEIVILSIDTPDQNVKSFIKSKLNYKKLKVAYHGNDKEFIVPVRFVPES